MRQEIRRLIPRLVLLATAAASVDAHASFLSGDTLDTVANVLAWFILIVMPPLAIGLFLMVHVLPEKIAEKRHHPQKESIKVLCILSLVFGGMLWPFAWLWAYTRPSVHKAVYGTEMDDSYYIEMAEKLHQGKLSDEEIAHLHSELRVMESKGHLARPLWKLLDELNVLEASKVPVVTASAPSQPLAARPVRTAHEGDD
jgi:hypothetical protein